MHGKCKPTTAHRCCWARRQNMQTAYKQVRRDCVRLITEPCGQEGPPTSITLHFLLALYSASPSLSLSFCFYPLTFHSFWFPFFPLLCSLQTLLHPLSSFSTSSFAFVSFFAFFALLLFFTYLFHFLPRFFLLFLLLIYCPLPALFSLDQPFSLKTSCSMLCFLLPGVAIHLKFICDRFQLVI